MRDPRFLSLREYSSVSSFAISLTALRTRDAGLLPVLAAELVEADGLVVAGRTDVFRDLVELSDRDIENVALVIANF